LMRFGARDYDSTTGRWAAKDPLRFGGGLTSLYSYIGGDPVTRSDPDGLDAELCTRRFYPIFIVPYARHCFIRFNGDNKDTLSFDPKGVHKDPKPDWGTCHKTSGTGDDDCVRREMKQCQADQYDFTGFNCCHCAEQGLNACSRKVPPKVWPNWPVNPGPQPGEPGWQLP
jgi:hypothetical protein